MHSGSREAAWTMDFTERKKIPAYFREVKIGNRGTGDMAHRRKDYTVIYAEGVLRRHMGAKRAGNVRTTQREC